MDKYEEFYKESLARAKKEHRDNAQKLRSGIRILFIVPIFFLALMFMTGANKAVFLVLFIISLFVIAFYLINLEYRDYKLQEKFLNRGSEEIEGLVQMNLDRVAGVVTNIVENMEEK